MLHVTERTTRYLAIWYWRWNTICGISQISDSSRFSDLARDCNNECLVSMSCISWRLSSCLRLRCIMTTCVEGHCVVLCYTTTGNSITSINAPQCSVLDEKSVSLVQLSAKAHRRTDRQTDTQIDRQTSRHFRRHTSVTNGWSNLMMFSWPLSTAIDIGVEPT